MSTITTTPAPQMSRTPLLVGVAVVGVLAVSAVVVPRIASTLGSSATTGTASSSTVITQHDLVEHRADLAASIDRARISSAIERQLTHEGKLRAGQIAATTAGLTGVRVGEATVSQQVGGLAPTFPYAPAAAPKMVYNGRGLVAVAAAPAVADSTLRQQVGGLAPTFPYAPAAASVGLVPVYGYNGRELVQLTPAIAPNTYTRWTDTFVPPFRDPAWRDAIKRHYAGTFTNPTTHEFR